MSNRVYIRFDQRQSDGGFDVRGPSRDVVNYIVDQYNSTDPKNNTDEGNYNTMNNIVGNFTNWATKVHLVPELFKYEGSGQMSYVPVEDYNGMVDQQNQEAESEALEYNKKYHPAVIFPMAHPFKLFNAMTGGAIPMFVKAVTPIAGMVGVVKNQILKPAGMLGNAMFPLAKPLAKGLGKAATFGIRTVAKATSIAQKMRPNPSSPSPLSGRTKYSFNNDQ